MHKLISYGIVLIEIVTRKNISRDLPRSAASNYGIDVELLKVTIFFFSIFLYFFQNEKHIILINYLYNLFYFDLILIYFNIFFLKLHTPYDCPPALLALAISCTQFEVIIIIFFKILIVFYYF